MCLCDEKKIILTTEERFSEIKRETDEQGWGDCLELECIASKGTCNGERNANILQVWFLVASLKL